MNVNRSSGSHMCYLAVFVVFVFITLYKVSNYVHALRLSVRIVSVVK
eukprot:COSAG02_NODE_919_length_15936_cov_5.055314_8_plen_47_part_00